MNRNAYEDPALMKHSLRSAKKNQGQARAIASPIGFLVGIPDLWAICFAYVRPTFLQLFQSACEKGRLEDAKWIWNHGYTIFDVRAFNNGALYRACIQRHLELAQWLWSLGLNQDDLKLIRLNLDSPSFDYYGGFSETSEHDRAMVKWLREIRATTTGAGAEK